MKNLTADAYNATKSPGDPDFTGLPGEYRAELEHRADAVVRTGLTTNAFEEKVKELSEAEKEPKTVPVNEFLGEPKTDGVSEVSKEEKPLGKMSREELDVIAKDEFGFNPSDYSNKAEIVAAIQDARAKNV